MNERTRVVILGRLGLMAAGLLLAATAAVNAMSNAKPELAPPVAFALSVRDQLRLRALDKAFIANQLRYADPAQARAVARKALEDEPLNARAIRMLAFVEEPKARSNEALSLLELAHRISRHEKVTELALMDAAVRRSDARAAVSQLDILLRRTPEGQPTVFPLLTRSLGEPLVQQEVSRHLIERSPWVRDFITFASTTGQQPGLAAEIVIGAKGKVDPDDLELITPPLLTRLVEAREFVRALRIFDLARGDRRIITRGEMTSRSTDGRFGLLAWAPVSEGSRSADFSPPRPNGARSLTVYGAPGARGLVASKILALAPGMHTLTQETVAQSGNADNQVRWQLRCAARAGQTPFWIGKSINLSGQIKSQERFAVPADCPFQDLTLLIKSSTQGQGIDLQIDSFTIN